MKRFELVPDSKESSHVLTLKSLPLPMVDADGDLGLFNASKPCDRVNATSRKGLPRVASVHRSVTVH